MISLEMAQKLKDAGLAWEPQRGDCGVRPSTTVHNARMIRPVTLRTALFFVDDVVDNTFIYTSWLGERGGCTGPWDIQGKSNFIFLPRLDQLLAEVEKRGYVWRGHQGPYGYNVNITGPGILDAGFRNQPTIDDAAASALLWILERGKE